MALREIKQVRQIQGELKRRWFTSETMDLIVWMIDMRSVHSFQLCYDKGREEKALTWDAERGFSHVAVDDGEGNGALNYKATPMLNASRYCDPRKIRLLFETAAQAVPFEVREFVLSKIESGDFSSGDASSSSFDTGATRWST